MYNSFFGFREKPFKLVPNPEYLFLSKSHEIALAHLTYATNNGEGFVVITGEIGTGKTTLCRNYLEGLDDHTESAYIFNPKMEYEQLLGSICQEFGLSATENSAKVLLETLYAYLIERNSADHKVVLVIDEAQGLSVENLELVRMLSNLETTRNKLLQIILVGQPELEKKLESHELRQLAQRISLSYQLSPLSFKDTQAYIRYRLGVASQQRRADLFSAAASRMVYDFSQGVPRLINIACDRALLTAYSQNQKFISRSIMQTAIREIAQHGRGAAAPRKRRFLLLGAGICLLALLIVAVVFTMRRDTVYNLVLTGLEYTGWNSERRLPTGATPAQAPNDDAQSSPTDPIGSTVRVPAISVVEGSRSGPERENTGMNLRLQSTAATSSEEPNDGAERSSPSDTAGSTVQAAAASVAHTSDSGPVTATHTAPQNSAEKMANETAQHESSQDFINSEPGDTLGFAELIGELDSESSRKSSVTALLTIWHQSRANVDLIPVDVEDENFFQLAARQYGLRCYTIHDNWPLVQKLNLPAIVAMTSPSSDQAVYLPLIGWRGERLLFKTGLNGVATEVDADVIHTYVDGPVFVFWDNVFGYEGIIGLGAKDNAVFILKNLLRQIGYNQLDQAPTFDSLTHQSVMDFQSRHQLEIDGLVGPLTKIMLLQQSGSVNMPTLD